MGTLIDVSKLASEIITAYLQEPKVDPTESLIKIAKRDSLNKNWIYRVAEVVNVGLHQKVAEQVGSPMVEFSLANPREAVRQVQDEKNKVEKTASDDFDKITEMEKGASIAAAEECVYYLEKKMEKKFKENPELEKIAHAVDGSDSILTIRALSIKKMASDFAGLIDGEMTGCERKLANIIKEIGSTISREVVGDDKGKVLSYIRKSAQASFPNYIEGVNAIIDKVKNDNPSLSHIKEASISSDVSLERDSAVHGLFEDFIEESSRFTKLSKMASEIVDENIVRLPETETEGQAILTKIAFMGAVGKGLMTAGKWGGKAAIKNPLTTLFAGMNVKDTFGQIKKDIVPQVAKAF
jgi:hypothetical protein